MPRHLEEGHIEINFNLIHMTCTPKKNRATTSFFPPNFQYNEISVVKTVRVTGFYN